MKKWVAVILTAGMLLSASSAASAAPVTGKKHVQKLHAKKKVHHPKGVHAKSLKTKATQLPKTGFGGASEQTE